MKKLLLSAAITAATAAGIAAQSADDKVLMTVDGKDVFLSEFEYLYNKNNSQQLVPLTFDEYVDMFVNYKLKVADALHERVDTTADYKAEISKFRRDLAKPYLVDSTVTEVLILEAYAHTAEDVYVSHIMLPGQDPAGKQKLDSIRALIVAGQISFEDAARENSVDRNSAPRGGRMGWVTGAGMYPWAFEEAAYNTPVGEVSETVNSGIGYHLVRPEMRRPAAGQVLCEHILLFTRGKDDAAKAVVKERIDSIYQVVTQPNVEFSEVATRLSEDRGSAPEGGRLDWFGPGQMVAEFDSVAFAMPVGAISEPFATQFGYHIIHKIDQRKPGSLEQMRPAIEKSIAADPVRSNAPARAKIRSIAQSLGSSIDLGYRDVVASALAATEGIATESNINTLKESDFVVFSAAGKDYLLGEVIKMAPLREESQTPEVTAVVDRFVQQAFDNAMCDFEIGNIYNTVPAYRNLLNEYRDGILLFDVSQKKVWDKAASDPAALQKYFKAHKKEYSTWEAPKYKAYVIFTASDSLSDEVKSFLGKKYGKKKITAIDQDEFTESLKEAFGSKIRVQRVIAAKGENEITDYLGFGGEKADAKNKNFPSYFAWAGTVVSQPEEYLDVKGQVLTDYQNQLEKEWIRQLHKQYPVVIDQEVLKIAKEK